MRWMMIALALTAAGCVPGSLDDRLYVCSGDDDCGDGWRCVKGSTGQRGICRPADWVADAAGPDALGTDAPGADAEVPDAASDVAGQADGTGAADIADGALADTWLDAGPSDVLDGGSGDVSDGGLGADSGAPADVPAGLDTAVQHDGAVGPDSGGGPDVTDLPDVVVDPDADALDAQGPPDGSDVPDAPDAVDADAGADVDAGTPPCVPEQCPDDPLPCVVATCIDGATCGMELLSDDWCLIADGCVEAGATIQGCLTCVPSLDPQGWTAVETSCDDGDLCTADTCDAATGCAHGTVSCDDGDACTLDTCEAATGCAHGTVSCDDGDACTLDTCEAAAGCVHAPVSCDDGDVCTADSCGAAAGCVHAPVSCDDGDVCTADTCDPVSGCINDAGPCNDGDACTTDSCDGGAGCVHGSVSCDDGDACTVDSCVPATGCIHGPVLCDDGDVCTVDACDPAGGCSHAPVDCDDADLCTADSCGPDGCGHVAEGCDDGNPCTVDSCTAAGGCATTAAECDDGDPCTADFCDSGSGCASNVTTGPACDDGDACTASSFCVGGTCVSGDSADCDDGVACTADSCDPASGCASAPVQALCEDGFLCTVDVCDPVAGCTTVVDPSVCQGTGDPCTVTTCEFAVGCVYTPTTGPCDDGDPCTTGEACDSGSCVAPPNPFVMTLPTPVNTTSDGDPGYDDAQPAAAVGDSTTVAVWASESRMGPDAAIPGPRILATRRAGVGGWGKTKAVSGPVGVASVDQVQPTVAADRDGNWLVAWAEKLPDLNPDAYVLRMVRSTTDGASYGDATTLYGAGKLSGEETHPLLAWIGGATYILVWQSTSLHGMAVGSDADLFVTRTTDRGVTWSEPALVNSDAASDGGREDVLGPGSLAVQADGTVVVAWTATGGATTGADADIFVSTSADGGLSWSAPAALYPTAAADGAADTNPAVATDGMGGVLVVWESTQALGLPGGNIGADPDILLVRSSDGGQSWSAPVALDAWAAADTAVDQLPRVIWEPTGTWFVTWTSDYTISDDSTDQDIVGVFSHDGGATWSAPKWAVSYAVKDKADDTSSVLVVRSPSHLSLLWLGHETEYTGTGDVDVLSDELNVAPGPCDDGDALTLDACDPVAGCSHATSPQACDDGVGCTIDALVAGVCENTPTSALCDDGAACTDEICDAVAGCVYTENEAPCPGKSPCTEASFWSACQCLSEPSAPVFGTSTRPVGLPAAGAAAELGPRLASDGVGSWMLVWSSDMPVEGTPTGSTHVYAQRSTDGGKTWGAPVRVDKSASAPTNVAPSVVALGSGSFMVAWTRGDPTSNGAQSRVVTSVTSTAGQSWSNESVVPNSTQSNDGWPLLGATAGGVVLVFSSTWDATTVPAIPDYTDWEIYSVLSADGGGSWSSRVGLGPSVGQGVGDDRTQRAALAGDGAGNWVVVWSAQHALAGGTDQDLFVSRSSNDGTSWLSATLLHGSMAAGGDDGIDDGAPVIVTNGAGLWRVLWTRGVLGTSTSEVYVLSSTNKGNTWNTPTQIATPTKAMPGTRPALATDGTGTWVAAWASSKPDLVTGQAAGPDEDLAFMWEKEDGLWHGLQWLDTWATSDAASDQALVLAAGAGGEWVGAWETRHVPPATTVSAPDIAVITAGNVWQCDDGDPATQDRCDRTQGCVYE